MVSEKKKKANTQEYYPQRIIVEESCRDYPLTKRILENLGFVSSDVVSAAGAQALCADLMNSRNPLAEGKRYLFLTTLKKGRFVKPCPCTPRYIGCNYFIINLNLNCPLDCTYCILQHYLSQPWITLFVNLEDLWRELDVFLTKRKAGPPVRIGTGELGDSLALDHFTEISRDLISYFRNKKNAVFELKTKTVNIDRLQNIKPADNVVVSWSLNAPSVAQTEEAGAPSVGRRIEAASKISESGFRVGFHFDPLVLFPGWKNGYAEVIRRLFESVPTKNISWISLGSLRFPPRLKTIIKTRFPGTGIIHGEFIPGLDGKWRYFRPLRLELYAFIVQQIKKWGGENIPLYFCMEGAAAWRQILKWTPRGKRDVESRLSPERNDC
jgi:spore photoproduct lyase